MKSGVSSRRDRLPGESVFLGSGPGTHKPPTPLGAAPAYQTPDPVGTVSSQAELGNLYGHTNLHLTCSLLGQIAGLWGFRVLLWVTK